jgi:hypothetical protein
MDEEDCVQKPDKLNPGQECKTKDRIQPKEQDGKDYFEANMKCSSDVPLVVSYDPCPSCNYGNNGPVLSHHHINKIEELYQLINMIKEHIEANRNIVVVMAEESSKDTLKAEDFLETNQIKAENEDEVLFENDNDDESWQWQDNDDEEDSWTPKKRGRPKIILTPEERMEKNRIKEQKKQDRLNEQKTLGRSFSCEECPKMFSGQSSKRRHIEIVHRKNPTYVKTYEKHQKKTNDYICPTCGLALHDTYAKFFRHKELCEAQATGINKHVCSICGRSFPTSSQHGSHYTSCSGKGKKYYNSKSCSYENCEFKTSSKQELDNHTRKVHLNLPIEKNHVCTICGNSYNKVTILNNHIKAVHQGEKPYECETCGKAFARKQKMKEHMLIHTGDASWMCPLCGKSMTNSGSKYNHKRSCAGAARETLTDQAVILYPNSQSSKEQESNNGEQYLIP